MSLPDSVQPAVVYPQAITTQPSHSNGSFGPVFAVLAVITVLAALACFLGRMCIRRYSSRHKTRGDGRTFHVKGDLEYGFQGNTPPTKPVRNGGKEAKPAKKGATEGKPAKNGGSEAKPAKNGGAKEAKATGNGEGTAKPAENGQAKQSA